MIRTAVPGSTRHSPTRPAARSRVPEGESAPRRWRRRSPPPGRRSRPWRSWRRAGRPLSRPRHPPGPGPRFEQRQPLWARRPDAIEDGLSSFGVAQHETPRVVASAARNGSAGIRWMAVALKDITTGAPSSRSSSRAERRVTSASSGNPQSTATLTVAPSGVTRVTVPATWLRAESIQLSVVARQRSPRAGGRVSPCSRSAASSRPGSSGPGVPPRQRFLHTYDGTSSTFSVRSSRATDGRVGW